MRTSFSLLPDLSFSLQVIVRFEESETFGLSTHRRDQINFPSSYLQTHTHTHTHTHTQRHKKTRGRYILNALFFAFARLPVRLVMVGWCGHSFNSFFEFGVCVCVGVCVYLCVYLCAFSLAITTRGHSLSTSSHKYLRAAVVTAHE